MSPSIGADLRILRVLQLPFLYRWLEEEDEIGVNSMARMRPPIVPEQPVPVVPEDGLRRLLATCAGKGFEDRRDTALILLPVDVGPRRAELMGLKVTDVDFDLDVLLVLGKGRRERALPFGRKSAVVLDRLPTYGSVAATRTLGCPGSGWGRRAG
jgi:site-specific recombinase XerC